MIAALKNGGLQHYRISVIVQLVIFISFLVLIQVQYTK